MDHRETGHKAKRLVQDVVYLLADMGAEVAANAVVDTVGAPCVEDVGGAADAVEDKGMAVVGFDMVVWRPVGAEGRTGPFGGSDEGLVDRCRSQRSCCEYRRHRSDRGNVDRVAFLQHILAGQVVEENSRLNRSRPQPNRAARGAAPFAESSRHLAGAARLCGRAHEV